MAGLIRKSFDTPDETRPFEEGNGQAGGRQHRRRRRRSGDVRARLAVVEARQADRRNRQLPGRPHVLLRLRADEGRHGRRRGDGVRPGRLRVHGAGPRRLDRRRRAVRGRRLAGLRRLRQALTRDGQPSISAGSRGTGARARSPVPPAKKTCPGYGIAPRRLRMSRPAAPLGRARRLCRPGTAAHPRLRFPEFIQRAVEQPERDHDVGVRDITCVVDARPAK